MHASSARLLDHFSKSHPRPNALASTLFLLFGTRCRSDARGWGRYTGRIYQGNEGKVMVVVVMYAPDAQYDVSNEEREVNIAKHRLLLINDLLTADVVIHPHDENGLMSDQNGFLSDENGL